MYPIDILTHRYIFKKQKPKIPKKLMLILDRCPEVKLLMDKTCPWCGKKFSGRRGLLRHLDPNGNIMYRNINKCSLMYMQLLTHINNIYYEIRFDIDNKNKTNTTSKYYVRGINYYFTSLDEAVDAWFKLRSKHGRYSV